MKGYAKVALRDKIDLSLIRTLPDSGSPVIAVYLEEKHTPYGKPGSGGKVDYVEIELPDFAGNGEQAARILKSHLPSMEFNQVGSIMPEYLVCSTIFRASLPEKSRYPEFWQDISSMSDYVKTLYPTGRPFFDGMMLA